MLTNRVSCLLNIQGFSADLYEELFDVYSSLR